VAAARCTHTAESTGPGSERGTLCGGRMVQRIGKEHKKTESGTEQPPRAQQPEPEQQLQEPPPPTTGAAAAVADPARQL
jgi:hypothetical protein